MPSDIESITVRAPAKINISLGIGPRRPDGFHEVHTVYQAVDLYDRVTVRAADRLTLQITGPEAGQLKADDTNLAWRAAELLGSFAGREPAVLIQLHKLIPVAAGLAGGSADAAAVLRALDQLWQLDLSDAELTSLASQLGSDVAFSLLGGTALGRGRGEQLTPLPGYELHWVLAVADGGLSTAAVYAELDSQRAQGTAPAPIGEPVSVLAALKDHDLVRLSGGLGNDLQPAATALAPYLSPLLAAGQRAGALAVLVSGSGPTILMLAGNADHARDLSAVIGSSGLCRYALPVLGGVPGAREHRAGAEEHRAQQHRAEHSTTAESA